jgi:hypothetical protein
MERLGIALVPHRGIDRPSYIGMAQLYLAAVNPKMLHLAGAIADHMVDALGLMGSADECRAKVDAFVAAGVDMPIILPFTPESEPAPAYERTIAAFRASPSG